MLYEVITVLARAADQVARGDLDMNLPTIRARDEVGRLAQSFVAMKHRITSYNVCYTKLLRVDILPPVGEDPRVAAAISEIVAEALG